MTHAMEQKLQLLDDYISRLDEVIKANDQRTAEKLQTEIIAVYDSEIDSLKAQLDNYSITHFGERTPVDYVGDAQLSRAQLINYKINLASGLYKQFKSSDGAVTVTQQVSQDVETNVDVSLDQVITNINSLPASELSDEEKETLCGKIASISAERDKQKRWEKTGNALKWIAEKGIQVGIAALPYIAKALEASP